MKTGQRSNNVFPNRNNKRRRYNLTVALALTTMMSLIVPSHQLSLSTIISALPITTWPQPPTRQVESQAQVTTIKTVTSLKLAVPSLQLSMSDNKHMNGIYTAQDPKTIPVGFIRMCSKAGGYAPRPLWDDMTNGITPWFESKNGCFVYFNSHDSKWWIDDEMGCPMFLAGPDGSLLLPPLEGWVTLTGRRVGVPNLKFM